MVGSGGKTKQTPTIGRIVRYVLREADGAGVGVRPAMVTSVAEDGTRAAGTISLTVFMVPSLDGPGFLTFPFLTLPTVVNDDDTKNPGTWHWPDRT